MLEFIAHYWLEVAFGLVCAAIAWVAKNYIQLLKKDRQGHETEIITSINKKLDDQYKKTQQQMDDQYQKQQDQMDHCYKNLTSLIEKQGEELKKVDTELSNKIVTLQTNALAIEGAFFKSECRRLLDPEHIITESEFNTITVEHIGYNGLGGNHEGDALFKSVEHKYESQQYKHN